MAGAPTPGPRKAEEAAEEAAAKRQSPGSQKKRPHFLGCHAKLPKNRSKSSSGGGPGGGPGGPWEEPVVALVRQVQHCNVTLTVILSYNSHLRAYALLEQDRLKYDNAEHAHSCNNNVR